MVKIRAIDEDGNALYPTKWNHDFIEVPRINPREQRQPIFAADQIVRKNQARKSQGTNVRDLMGCVRPSRWRTSENRSKAFRRLVYRDRARGVERAHSRAQNRECATYDRITPQRGKVVEEFHRARRVISFQAVLELPSTKAVSFALNSIPC